MFSLLRRLSEKSLLARVLSAARPARRFLQLALVTLAAHIPLACVLAVGVLGERRVNARDSLITRCSPRAETLWTVFVAVCGLLATATNVYCVDQLTSTPASRAARAWPRWLRRTHNPARPQSSCGGSPGIEMPTIRPAPAPDEPLSPADGFSPHNTHDERPPTYQQATAVPLHIAHPTLVHIRGPANPRPRMVRRQAASQVPTQRLLHRLTSGPPHWSTRSTAFLLLWILTLSTLFLACTAPLIASSAVQPLVRDAVYAHACDGFEWEVLLHARRGSPTAEFVARTSPRSFTMQLQKQRGGYALGTQRGAVSYETLTHAYRGLFAGVPLHGTYNVTGERWFPELGLRGGGRKDYFGFPRVVMQREKGAAAMVTTRVKRGSCEDMKVCVRGVKPAVAAVVVGPLLVETVEAAGKCRGG